MPAPTIVEWVQAETQQHVKASLNRFLDANNKHFAAACERLERWSEDKIYVAEKANNDIKEQIKGGVSRGASGHNPRRKSSQPGKAADTGTSPAQATAGNLQPGGRSGGKRDELISNPKQRLSRGYSDESLFTDRWAVVLTSG
jgi:hypothetical protein